MIFRQFAQLLCTPFIIFSYSSYAEEGGSGHYFPGSMASFADGVSSVPTFLARLNVISYEGSNGGDRKLPIAGQTAIGVDAKSLAVGLTLFWAPEWGVISDKWNYAMSTTIPWVDIEVSADVAAAGKAVRRTDTTSALGDIVIQPLMLNYHHSADLNVNFRVTLYAPTGSYEVGQLANTGKNFWTIEPTAAVIYLGQNNGIEASLFYGIDFNQENPDTKYKSGNQMHFDGTLAQHFPLWGGAAGAGISGYWYRQTTADSGEGANLGGFKAKANGIGPVISYSTKIGKKYLIGEFKWLHEFDNQNRLEGDTLFLKVLLNFN